MHVKANYYQIYLDLAIKIIFAEIMQFLAFWSGMKNNFNSSKNYLFVQKLSITDQVWIGLKTVNLNEFISNNSCQQKIFEIFIKKSAKNLQCLVLQHALYVHVGFVAYFRAFFQFFFYMLRCRYTLLFLSAAADWDFRVLFYLFFLTSHIAVIFMRKN